MQQNLSRPQRNHVLVLLALAGPAIAEQILMTAVNYVDAAMVGALGPAATAAVAINSSPTWFIMSFFMGISVGYSVQVAHAVGAKDAETTRNVIRQAVLAALVVGIGMMLICLTFVHQLPVWMGADPEILPDARAYILIVVFALPFSAMQSVFSAIVRCMGDTRTPLVVGIFTNLFNVLLNYLFIFPARQVAIGSLSFTMWGAGLGVAGAALGTAISVCAGGLLLLRSVFTRPHPYKVTVRGSYKPDSAVIRRAFALGAPTALDRIAISTGQLVMTKIVASLGTAALAANYVAVTAEALCYLPAMGISFAATTLVGQSVGAGDREQARQYSKVSGWTGFIFSVCMSVILFVFSVQLASIFSPDPKVISLAASMLRIVSLAEPFFGLSMVLAGVLRGAGDVRWPFFISLIGMWGLRMAGAIFFVFVLKMGLAGVWFGMAMDLWFRGIALAVRTAKGKWLLKSLQKA